MVSINRGKESVKAFLRVFFHSVSDIIKEDTLAFAGRYQVSVHQTIDVTLFNSTL